MSKHTPGPWGVEQTETTNWIGPMRNDGKVAEIVADTDREELKPEYVKRNDANARLIAAAPSLLEALEMAEATVMRLNRHNSANGTLDVIRAAIAKATGGSND